MVGEIYAGFGAVKAAFDIAKGLKDIHDATLRNAAVIELQEKILSAQMAQATLIDRVGGLEKEVANFEAWTAGEQRYELKNVGMGAFAYMLKPEARRGEPPHFVCTNCYNQRRISIIQWETGQANMRAGFRCPACRALISPGTDVFTEGHIKWLS